MNKPSSSGNHAVVIGGSMAGLLTARVLSDHFDLVTVIERDRLPEGPETRPGVPQARHAHVLMVRGLELLTRFFPGIREDLTAAGAVPCDIADEIAWLTPAGWGVRFRSGLCLLTCSRDLLEWSVRRRLCGNPRVHFHDECETTGLLLDAGGKSVIGVSYRSRQGAEADSAILADLVVDASGRASRMPDWLERAGFEAPEETIVNGYQGYASRIYRRPTGFTADWQGVYLQAAPPERTRTGLVLRLEEDRWLVTLSGGDRDYPPTDEEGFHAFARSLPEPMVWDAIRQAEPLSPIAGHRGTENRRRHYERLARFPERVLVIGDAACAFNPVYGQGMTTAALSADALDRLLTRWRRGRTGGDLTGLSRAFQRALAATNAVPWMLATSEDYRYRGTTGDPPGRATRLMHRYMDQVTRLSTRDVGVRRVLLNVFHMRYQPTALFHPSILLRAVGQVLVSRQSDLLPERELIREA